MLFILLHFPKICTLNILSILFFDPLYLLKQTVYTFVSSLLNHLRNSKPHEDADGAIDNINLILLLAFLYTIDLSLLHKEDGESKYNTANITNAFIVSMGVFSSHFKFY